MKLQLYVPDGRYEPWIEGFAQALPEETLAVQQADTDDGQADVGGGAQGIA